jgi:hypothetical protein
MLLFGAYSKNELGARGGISVSQVLEAMSSLHTVQLG